mgnify:CR=1 FL=1
MHMMVNLDEWRSVRRYPQVVVQQTDVMRHICIPPRIGDEFVQPTADELELVREYSAAHPNDPAAARRLGRVERLFLELAEVPGLARRLEAMQTVRRLGGELAALQKDLASVTAAAGQVRNSEAVSYTHLTLPTRLRV